MSSTSIDDVFPDGQWVNDEEYLIRCPVCGDGSHNHCYINIQKRVYNCYYCSEGGTLAFLLRRYADGRDVVLGEKPRNVKAAIQPTDFWQFNPLGDDMPSSGWEAQRYLSDRGIEPYESMLYQLRYATEGKYKGRVVIPIFDQSRERVVCFSARSYIGEKPKYLFPAKGETLLTTSESVFGIHWAHEYRNVVLVEGAFDAMSVNRKLPADWCGVALLSKHMCQGQLLKLLRLPRNLNLFVMMDADAFPETMKISQRLAYSNFNVWAARLEKGDPDGASPEELLSTVSQAERV